MNTLLSKYINCGNDYVASYNKSSVDDGLAENLDKSGFALRAAVKNKGLDLKQFDNLINKFISSNVHRKTENKKVAAIFEKRNIEDIQNLKNFLGV